MADEVNGDTKDAILAKAGDTAKTWQASLAMSLRILQGRAKAMGSTIGPAGRLSLCCIDDDGGKLVTLVQWRAQGSNLHLKFIFLQL